MLPSKKLEEQNKSKASKIIEVVEIRAEIKTEKIMKPNSKFRFTFYNLSCQGSAIIPGCSEVLTTGLL